MLDSKFELATAKLDEAKRRKRLLGNTIDYKIGHKGTRKAIRDRARETCASFANLWSWWIAHQSSGFEGLLPNWIELAEKSQKIANQRYTLLGDLIYLDVITDVNINQLAARLPTFVRHYKNKKTHLQKLENEIKKHPAFGRAKKLIRRWQDGGLWGLAPEANPFRLKYPRGDNVDPAVLTDEEINKIYKQIDSVIDLASRDKGSVTREEVAARAEKLGVSPRTVYYRIDKVRNNKLKELRRRRRGDIGKSHGLSDKMVLKIEDLRLTHKDWKARAVWEAACKYAEKTGENPPSLGQVYRIINNLAKPLRLLADGRIGEFNNKYRPTKRLKLDEKLILLADFTPLPMLFVPGNQHTKTNKSGDVTAYLLEIMEANSRYVFPPIFAVKTPTQVDVAASIRNAMLVIGFFNELWVDRGKQYISRRIRRISKRFRFKLFPGPPHYPQLRGKLERYFETAETRFFSTLEGYTGPDIAKRNPTAKAKHTLDWFIERYEEFREKYNNEVHSETGQIPAVAVQNRPTYSPGLTDSERAELDLLLKFEGTAVISNKGIRYKNHWYYDTKLIHHEGEKVTIYAEPGEGVAKEIKIYLNEKELCTALNTTSEAGKALLEKIGNDQRAQVSYYRKRIKEAREREKQEQASADSELKNDNLSVERGHDAIRLAVDENIVKKPTPPEAPKNKKKSRFGDFL